MVYRITKTFDKTRPCIDTSGNFHVETDIFDVHDYEQHPDEFRTRYGPGTEPIYERFETRQRNKPGQPVFVSEYGGIRWVIEQYSEKTWGYGKAPEDLEEVYTRLEALTDTIRSLDYISGFCYTQLTDVEQEQNGIYTYDRREKFDAARLYGILSKRPAWAEE